MYRSHSSKNRTMMAVSSSSSSSSSTERSLLLVDAMPSSPASWNLPSRRLEPEPHQRQRWRIGAGLLSIVTTILLGLLGSVVVDLGGRSTVASATTTTRETTAAAPERTRNTNIGRRHQQDARYADWEHFLAHKSTAAPVISATAAAAAVVVVSDSEGSATTTPPPPLLYFNDSAAFARVTPADDFFHYQNGWEAQRTQVRLVIPVHRGVVCFSVGMCVCVCVSVFCLYVYYYVY